MKRFVIIDHLKEMTRMMSKENVIILAQMVQMVLVDMVQVQVEARAHRPRQRHHASRDDS